jgi:hypothetical protein
MAYLNLGPHLQAALLCERVLYEKDGVVTIVRLIDRVVVHNARATTGAQVPAAIVACHAVVILKTGSRPGNYKLRLVLSSPSQRLLREFSVDVSLPGEEDQGVNVVMPIQFLANEEGVYWLDVKLNNEEPSLTRISLRLVYRS